MNIEQEKMIVESLPSLYPMMQKFEEEAIWAVLDALKIAEGESFEWCTDCKEYDQEKHCCHRFTKVIRQAFEEIKVVHCIDCQHSEYDEIYKDRYCHFNGKAEVVDDYHFCRDGERREDG